METNPWSNGDGPEDPEDLLPEESVLSLEEYLDMQAAIGNRTRFEIVYRLAHTDEMTPTELDAVMDVDDSTLHYHLNELRDVALIEKRVRTERDRDGSYTYYRSTILGDCVTAEAVTSFGCGSEIRNPLLEHGVEALLRREWEFRDAYDSSRDGS